MNDFGPILASTAPTRHPLTVIALGAGNRGQTTKSLEQLPPRRPNLPSGRCTSYCSPCFRTSGRPLLADYGHKTAHGQED